MICKNETTITFYTYVNSQEKLSFQLPHTHIDSGSHTTGTKWNTPVQVSVQVSDVVHNRLVTGKERRDRM